MLVEQLRMSENYSPLFSFAQYTFNTMYWVVRKIRADVEGKLKRRRFKF